MLAYTYIEKGTFSWVEKPKPASAIPICPFWQPLISWKRISVYLWTNQL